jgi:MraZ protein
LDRCIFMFAEDEWRSQEAKFKNMSFTKKETRSFNRLFFSGAADISPDKQGRFIVPQYLKDYASIKKDVMIIGVSNRLEIWNLESWKKFYSDLNENFEKIAENILDL